MRLLTFPMFQKFCRCFSKAITNTLAPHCPYDLKINLEEDASLPINPMYSLSQSELTTLQEFINKHLQIGFIHPTNSPHGAPVLFVQKKDGSLQLCVNFRGLNKSLKKTGTLFLSFLICSPLQVWPVFIWP